MPSAWRTLRRTSALAALLSAVLSGQAIAGSITLDWDPVTDADLGGYKIYYGVAPDIYANVLDVGNLTHYKISGLSDCQQYSFAVKAYDQNGNSSLDFSNSIVGLPDPRLTSLSPSSAQRGQSLTLTVNGKNFEPGVSLSVSDKVNVFYTSFVSCSQARATVSVAGDAALTTNAATMTNPSGLRATLASAFTILPVTYPFVIAVSPAPGASEVPLSVKPTVTFSERMNPDTIKPETVRLLGPSGAPVPQGSSSPSLDSSGKVVTLKFAASLQSGTLYRLDIQGGGAGVRDAQGTPMLTTITYGTGFMTTSALLGDSPSVTSATPSPDDVDVATTVEPLVTFSKPMDPATITADSIELRSANGTRIDQAPGSPELDPAAMTVKIVPALPLANSQIYRIRVVGGDAGVRDVEGFGLEAEFAQSPGFMTCAGENLPPPQVTALSPSDGASGVSIEVEPTAAFSQPMLRSSVNAATVLLLDPLDRIVPQAEGSPRLDACGETATLTPAERLSYSTGYRIMVVAGADGVRNVGGGLLETEILQDPGFSTLPAAAFGPPVVIAANPNEGSQMIPWDIHPTITFSEAMDPTSIGSGTVRLVGPDGADIEQAEGSPILESSGRIVTLVPSQPLTQEGAYRLVVEAGDTGVLDTEGELMPATYAQETGFSVELPDLDLPRILGMAPEDGDRSVPIDIHPTVTFTEPMDESRVNALTLLLLDEDGMVVPQADGSPSLDATLQMATLTPAEPLDRRRTYRLQIVGGPEGVADLSGKTLLATVSQAEGFRIARGQYDNDDEDPDAGRE